MILFSTLFKKRSGTTYAGVCSVALGSTLLLCGAGLTPTGNEQQADINANGFSVTNAATIQATTFVGPLNGTNLINGTVAAGKLAAVAPTTLTYASTLTVNSSAVTLGRCALTGDVTIAVPTSPVDGGKLELWLTASGAARNLSVASGIVVPSESSFTNPKTLANGKTYIVLLKYDGVTGGGQWELASIVGGY